MTKIGLTALIALGCAAIAGAACDGGGTGGSGASGTSSSGSGGGSSTSTSTSTSSGMTSTSSGMTSTSSGMTSTSSSGMTAGHCTKACAAAADCCPMGLPNCPGPYPANYTCDNGGCNPPQCASKTDCTNAGFPASYDCLDIGSVKACVPVCTTDNECTAPATCNGMSGATKFCKQKPCSMDAECPNGTCQNGTCVCANDMYCAGLGKCMGGACVCDTDADCTAAFANHCAH